MTEAICFMCGDSAADNDKIYIQKDDDGRAICEACVHLCSVLVRDKKAQNNGEYGCDNG